MSALFRISIFNDLDAVSQEWPRGAVAPDGVRHHPFQSITFLRVWLDSFGRSGRRSLHLVEVRDADNRPVLFLPLCITHSRGARVLEFIDAEAADYNAPILFPTSIAWTREVAQAMCRSIADLLPPFDLVMFSKMPAEIDGLVNPLGLVADQPNGLSCHGNDLRRSWGEIEAGVPQRKTLMRKIRNLERMAPLSFRVAEEAGARRAATDAFLRQKQWRFEQTRVPGFDVDAEKHDFFRNGTEVFAREGMLKLFYLQSGEEIIATIWGLSAGRRYYAIMLSFEGGAWGKYSPGSVLYYRTLQWLCENGYEWLDLGIGDEAWKLESCETTFPLAARERPVTLRGRLFLLRRRVAAGIRATALWQALRPLKWVILRRLRQAGMVAAGWAYLPVIG